MFVIYTLLLFLSALVLQTTLMPFLQIGGIKPDLVLVIVVYLGLIRGPEVGCVSGFFFGLIEDFFSLVGNYLGSNALTKTIIGFFCGMGGRQLYTQSLLSHMLCVSLSTVVDLLIHFSIKGFPPEWKQFILYQTLYNLLCCPFIVLLFRQGEKRWGKLSTSSNF